MNELMNYLILGFIQGVTEFFPVSSSGHLVLFEDFLKIKNAGASAEIIAHFGTLFSIILFYKATFFSNKNSDDFFHLNTLKMLSISTIPAILCGLFFDLEVFFNYDSVKTFLMANGLILLGLSGLRANMDNSSIFESPREWKWNYKTAFFLGFFQAFAMLPGISRSGMVISSALFFGLDKKKAIQYANFVKEKKGLNKIHFVQSSAESLPFKDGFFDAVISISVLQYVNREKVFKEINFIKKIK